MVEPPNYETPEFMETPNLKLNHKNPPKFFDPRGPLGSQGSQGTSWPTRAPSTRSGRPRSSGPTATPGSTEATPGCHDQLKRQKDGDARKKWWEKWWEDDGGTKWWEKHMGKTLENDGKMMGKMMGRWWGDKMMGKTYGKNFGKWWEKWGLKWQCSWDEAPNIAKYEVSNKNKRELHQEKSEEMMNMADIAMKFLGRSPKFCTQKPSRRWNMSCPPILTEINHIFPIQIAQFRQCLYPLGRLYPIDTKKYLVANIVWGVLMFHISGWFLVSQRFIYRLIYSKPK